MPRLLSRALFWFKASRPAFFTGSVMPIFIGGALAYSETGHLLWGYFLLTLLALMLLHAAANLANDYYDHVSGNDWVNKEFVSPFTGGSRLIQQGQVEPRSVLVAAVTCLFVAALIGGYLTWARGWPILLLGLVGGLSGYFYTAKPLQLGYRGLGEIFIGLDFGVLPVLGAYYVQVQHFSSRALIASLPMAFLIMAVLWINQFQDYNADKAVNKLHWVVRLGRRRASFIYAGMLIAAHVSLLAGLLTGALPLYAAAALLTLPLSFRAIAIALRRYDDLPKLIAANATTIPLHLITGVLITLGVVMDRLM